MTGRVGGATFEGLTVTGDLDVHGSLYTNSGTGTAGEVLSFSAPEVEVGAIELTIADTISLAGIGNGAAFAVNGNGVIYGSGPAGAGGGISGVTLNLSSVPAGTTINFEKCTDGTGTNFVSATFTSVEDGSTTASSTTDVGVKRWFFSTVGSTHVRIRTSAGAGTVLGSWHGNNLTGMQANTDYIIYCKAPIVTSYPNIGAVKMSGGRNIVWIGGEINVPLQNLSGSDTYSRAIYTDYCTGTLHMEGLYLHGVDLSDGFQLYSPEAIIQIQNCRVGNPTEPIVAHDLSGFTDKHPDVIEGEGGWRELRIDKLTGYSTYQGLFMNQVSTKHGRFTIARRVDLNGASVAASVPTGSRQLFWVGTDTGRVILEDFYVQPHVEKTSGGAYNTLLTTCHWYGTTAEADPNRRSQVFLPAGLTNVTNGASPTSSRWVTEIYWPPKGNVVGHVKLGPPPGGEWVPGGTAGIHVMFGGTYTPPGYARTQVAQTLEQVASPLSQGRAVRPSTNKLKLWSYDPGMALASCAPISQTIYLTKLPIEETIYETTGLVVNVETAGSGLTAGQSLMAIYDRLGNKMAASADLSGVVNSTGQKAIVLTDVSPYTLMATKFVGGYADFVFVAWLFNGTTPPKFSALFDNAGTDTGVKAAAFNMGVDGTGGGIGPTGKFVIRFQKNLTGQTSLPGTLFFSNSSPTNFAPLVGFN